MRALTAVLRVAIWQTVIVVCVMSVLAQPARSADWFASPTGTAGGTGSQSAPWDLQTALYGPGSVQPGDLSARGGRGKGDQANDEQRDDGCDATRTHGRPPGADGAPHVVCNGARGGRFPGDPFSGRSRPAPVAPTPRTMPRIEPE